MKTLAKSIAASAFIALIAGPASAAVSSGVTTADTAPTGDLATMPIDEKENFGQQNVETTADNYDTFELVDKAFELRLNQK